MYYGGCYVHLPLDFVIVDVRAIITFDCQKAFYNVCLSNSYDRYARYCRNLGENEQNFQVVEDFTAAMPNVAATIRDWLESKAKDLYTTSLKDVIGELNLIINGNPGAIADLNQECDDMLKYLKELQK